MKIVQNSKSSIFWLQKGFEKGSIFCSPDRNGTLTYFQVFNNFALSAQKIKQKLIQTPNPIHIPLDINAISSDPSLVRGPEIVSYITAKIIPSIQKTPRHCCSNEGTNFGIFFYPIPVGFFGVSFRSGGGAESALIFWITIERTISTI